MMELDLLMFCSLAALFAGSVYGQGYGFGLEKCPYACDFICRYGNVLDKHGCATCECNPPPNVRCPPYALPVEPKQLCKGVTLVSAFMPMPSRRKCGPGEFCSISDPFELGECCKRRVIQPVLRCPNYVKIPLFAVTEHNCTSDKDCRWGEKCCTRGYGKQCVPGI